MARGEGRDKVVDRHIAVTVHDGGGVGGGTEESK